MAKKNIKKSEEKIVETVENNDTMKAPNDDVTVKSLFVEGGTDGEVGCCCSSNDYVRNMKYLSPMELESNERMLRMLVLYYEQMLRLDEVEGRPVMSDNRNRYTRLTNLHKKLIEYIENKVLTLEEYVWEN